mmetsp:Transcript_43847/g.132827  ORF Transcript_43847/g.132827 Transcript_43847/m.132827 type:complete len:216 (-) Transcript_43847:124-771(-)
MKPVAQSSRTNCAGAKRTPPPSRNALHTKDNVTPGPAEASNSAAISRSLSRATNSAPSRENARTSTRTSMAPGANPSSGSITTDAGASLKSIKKWKPTAAKRARKRRSRPSPAMSPWLSCGRRHRKQAQEQSAAAPLAPAKSSRAALPAAAALPSCSSSAKNSHGCTVAASTCSNLSLWSATTFAHSRDISFNAASMAASSASSGRLSANRRWAR